ncbi:MAG: Na/Pi cotransporter family protein [Clostridia bacterium]|nr:Na/Pi cotransporter family protein [Clostridia bacterium]
MTIFDILKFVGCLSLFLFGMSILGRALERRAGPNLKNMLGRITASKTGGILSGIGITTLIQSSSATTVMIVGFVNSGLLTLSQAINVIIGANVGMTTTAWILSLSGISSDNIIIQLFKSTSFSPVFAFIGIIMYMFCKSQKKKDTGTIMLGFAVLMTGMDMMSGSVAPLSQMPKFQNVLVAFDSPVVGLLAGTVFTAAIQSSAAAIGVLQVLSATGSMTYGKAIPIIMGMNIGTCITAILSSLDASKSAKRSALAHLLFNVFGAVVLLTVFIIVKAALAPVLLMQSCTLYGIALVHTVFNVITMIIITPLSSILEKAVLKIIPGAKEDEIENLLDDRLLNTPTLAIEESRIIAVDMASVAVEAMNDAISLFDEYDKDVAQGIRNDEEKADRYEDMLGTYLVKISAFHLSDADSAEVTKLMRAIGDFERITDHAKSILIQLEHSKEKNIEFSVEARRELKVLTEALKEILALSYVTFVNNDVVTAKKVEPLEQVIDSISETLRSNHIKRLKQGECSVESGFIWNDMLTDFIRTSDHCSNIAGAVIDLADYNMNIHSSLREFKTQSEEFKETFDKYSEKYAI